MTVKELKEVLDRAHDDQEVVICVETPSGYVCPDGAVVGIKIACSRGIDWHSHECLLIPEYKLQIANVEKWANRENEDNY